MNHLKQAVHENALRFFTGMKDCLAVQHVIAPLGDNYRLSARISALMALNAAVYTSCFIILHWLIVPILSSFLAMPETIIEDERRFTLHIVTGHKLLRITALIVIANLKALILIPVYQVSSAASLAFRTELQLDTNEQPPRSWTDRIIYTVSQSMVQFIVTFSLFLIAVVASWVPVLGHLFFCCLIAWRMSFFFHSTNWDLTEAGVKLAFKTRQIETQWAYYLGFGIIPSLLVYILPTEIGDLMFGLLHPLFCLLAVTAARDFSAFGVTCSDTALPVFAPGKAAGELVAAHLPRRARQLVSAAVG